MFGDLASQARHKLVAQHYHWSPDKQEKATQTVLEQAKLLCGDWAEDH